LLIAHSASVVNPSGVLLTGPPWGSLLVPQPERTHTPPPRVAHPPDAQPPTVTAV